MSLIKVIQTRGETMKLLILLAVINIGVTTYYGIEKEKLNNPYGLTNLHEWAITVVKAQGTKHSDLAPYDFCEKHAFKLKTIDNCFYGMEGDPKDKFCHRENNEHPIALDFEVYPQDLVDACAIILNGYEY